MIGPEEHYCHKHKLTLLRCPACDGTKGGDTTAERHKAKLPIWGKLGAEARRKNKAAAKGRRTKNGRT